MTLDRAGGSPDDGGDAATAPFRRARVVAATCLATVAGGALDAWSYVGHGRVFANAQSGNVVVMAADLSAGQASAAIDHSLSLAAFVAGLLLSSLGGRTLQL